MTERQTNFENIEDSADYQRQFQDSLDKEVEAMGEIQPSLIVMLDELANKIISETKRLSDLNLMSKDAQRLMGTILSDIDEIKGELWANIN